MKLCPLRRPDESVPREPVSCDGCDEGGNERHGTLSLDSFTNDPFETQVFPMPMISYLPHVTAMPSYHMADHGSSIPLSRTATPHPLEKQAISVDVCILGAGPGGAAAALRLSRLGVPCLVVDKAVFPRDKVCGDGLSGKVSAILERIDPSVAEKLRRCDLKVDSWGVTFVAPNRIGIDIPLKADYELHRERPVGFVCRRIDFDDLLVRELRARPGVRLMEGLSIDDCRLEEDGWLLSEKGGKGLRIKAKVLIVANGANSSFTRVVAGHQLMPDHHYAGVRSYYKGVKGCHREGFIELHFLKEVLPGYFWIFPLPDGRANVGLCMLSKEVARKKVNLRKLLMDTLAEDPVMRERFREAEPEGGIEGCGLPLGSRRLRLYGERYVLVGDAGHLIDPFTGEGIGNAMYSGFYAANRTAEALQKGDFSADSLDAYEKDVYRVLGQELDVSHRLQRMVRHPWLFNLLMRLGARNRELRDLMTCMFNDADLRNRFRDPRFYFRLLFGRA